MDWIANGIMAILRTIEDLQDANTKAITKTVLALDLEYKKSLLGELRTLDGDSKI